MVEKKLIKKEGDNGNYGFVDENGNWVIEPKFCQYAFRYGIAKVKLDGKYGYIKEDGTYLVEPKFDDAKDFRDGEAEVLDNGFYKILLADGSLKNISKMEEYVLSCRVIQNWGPGGWSFLEAACKDGKWTFDSWSRIMDDNYEWYDARYDDLEEDAAVVRYYDEVEHNKKFADWANSLNLSTPEEIGALLWANAQQLIDDAKVDQEDGGYSAPLRNLTLWIQLYNQLENIKSLGLMDMRDKLDLPKEKDLYLNPDKVKKEGVKLCAEQVADEDGYEYLNFSELLEYSRKPGDYNYISDYDFNFVDNDEDEDWDEDED